MFLHPISFRFTPPLLIPARRYQVNKSVLPTSIFDTSGMNKLADDPESEILTAAVKSSFFVRLTETHVSEIVANREPSDAGRICLRASVPCRPRGSASTRTTSFSKS